MRFEIVVLALGISVAVSSLARSQPGEWDEVELLDGRVLSGSVSREGSSYRIRQGHGSLLVPALAVIRLRQIRDPLEAYEEARASAQSTADRIRAAKLAESLGLRSQAKELYRRVLVDEPDHAEARAALGFVKHEGAWLTHDQHQRALGKVKFRGAWVSAAERRGVLEAEAQARREADEARWTPAPAGGVGSTRTRSAAQSSAGEAPARKRRRRRNSYDRRTPRRVIQLGISTPRRRARSRACQPYSYPQGYRPYGYQPYGYQPYRWRSQGRAYAPPRRSRPPVRSSVCPRQAAAARNRSRQTVQPQRSSSAPLAPPRQVLPLGAR